jgi:hypothetical protein
VEHGMQVVTIEAPSIDATYAIATEFATLPDVVTFGMVYCNFEDENLR